MSTQPDLRPINADIGIRAYVSQMWERRHLAIAIPVEEIRVSHQNTFLGNVWHLGNPMLLVGVYYVIFGKILNTDRGVDNFILWLTVGVFAYHLTSGTVLAGAKSISSNQGLMRSIRFPRALLPVSVVVEKILTFGFELVVLMVLALVTSEGVSLRWLALPLVVALHSCMNLGGAFITARLNDSFQDIQQIVPFLFRLGTYVTGVMIPVERFTQRGISPVIETLLVWNPIAAILALYRWVFLGTSLDGMGLARAIGFSVIILVLGFQFFRAAEWRYGRG
jgi:teichoic acid transport system permease protein